MGPPSAPPKRFCLYGSMRCARPAGEAVEAIAGQKKGRGSVLLLVIARIQGEF